MEFKESEYLELKREVTDDLAKEIIAFANTNGGKIYIGIDDNGKVIGVSKPDLVSQKVSNIITDSIDPDLMSSINIENLRIEGKEIIVIKILEGEDKPYAIRSKGLSSDGVYVRIGTTKKQASRELIRRMIFDSSGISYESIKSREQKLTFNYLEKKFRDKNMDYKFDVLGLKNDDGEYNFAGYLFSDQNTYDLKCATYEGLTKVIFRDREICEGSLLESLDKALLYAKYHNMTRGVITSNPQRIDQQDYPGDSIREALINGVIHKDYYMNGSTRLEFFDDRVEITSMGGLKKGMTKDDMLNGITSYRNPIIMRILHILEYIEHYGTGILRIKEAYDKFDNKPEFDTGKNYVRATLYNTNYYQPVKREETITITNVFDIPKGLTDQEVIIYKYIIEHESITRKEVESLLDVKNTRAKNILKSLMDKQIIVKVGVNKSIKYVIDSLR
ncbi:MAG: putative DNA binding domain-containing protein [Clostridia bacterium]|jgi:ATP-dependent DNA helicase RecG|nr:putative DNA binding domain-containing protein [Clostridia bacterium]